MLDEGLYQMPLGFVDRMKIVRTMGQAKLIQSLYEQLFPFSTNLALKKFSAKER